MESMLTKGAIKDILSGVLLESPILQVLTFKVINPGSHARYRMVLSDGQYFSASCMLGTQLNDVVDNEFKPNSIFKVTRYVANNISTHKKVFIVLDMDVLISGDKVGEKLGNPVVFDITSSTSSSETADNSSLSNQRTASNSVTSGQSPASGMGTQCHPIDSLSPYQNKWTICARVTNKSDIRTWSNSKGQGKLFSVELLDESGEIRATAFNDECDRFYEMIEIGKIYYISQAHLKAANKQYCSLKNDYEMTFNSSTKVSLCQEPCKMPSLKFDFVSIDQIEQLEKDTVVDIIGVCKDGGQLSTVQQKSTGKELKKRDIQLVDDSQKEIRLTIWGTQAETFDGSEFPIIALKGAKVTEFNGKSLSCLSNSKIMFNPDIKESLKLRCWFEDNGRNIETTNISGQKGTGAMSAPFKSIGEALAENLGCGDSAAYYSVKAMPSLIRKENCMYPACPSDNCNKKVIDMNNGMYRCEKCSQEFNSFNWRFLFSCQLTDYTDMVWVTVFQDQAEFLLQTTAAELAQLKENDEDEFIKVFTEATFKECFFTLRVKRDMYNGEPRLKTNVVSIRPFNAAEYNKILLTRIKKLYSVG